MLTLRVSETDPSEPDRDTIMRFVGSMRVYLPNLYVYKNLLFVTTNRCILEYTTTTLKLERTYDHTILVTNILSTKQFSPLPLGYTTLTY